MVLAAFLVGVGLGGPPAALGATAAEPLRFLPHWIPQAQFAGFYVAAEAGYFEDEGVTVEILAGGPERNPMEWLREGRADFVSLFLSQGLGLRGEGLPVVNVAQLLPESSLLLVAHAGSGIAEARDLDGRKVGVWPAFAAQPQALFERLEIQPEVVEQGASLGIFIWRGVDAVCAMRYNEFQQLYLSGYDPEDLVILSLEDYNVGFPEDGIYVLEPFREKQPEKVRAFVRAVRRGWKRAFEDPEMAVDLVMAEADRAGVITSRALQSRMLAALAEVYLDDQGALVSSELRPRDFLFVRESVQQFDGMEEPVRYEEFYRP